VLLKMGTYGFIRFAMPLFPVAFTAAAPYLLILAVIGIIYGALVCMVQPDMKKLVAYSSVSHLGFVMLGLFALNLQGVQGSIIQMLNHGISTGGLFLMVGIVYERRHTKLIAEFGGLWKVMPVYTAVSVIIVLSSVGLPGLNGFIGEYLILVGAFQASPVLAVISASAVILAAIYLLWLVQRVFTGEVTNPKNEKLKDLSWRELAVMAPLILFIVWVGVYPKPFLSKTETSATLFIKQVQTRASAQARAPLYGLVAAVMPDAPATGISGGSATGISGGSAAAGEAADPKTIANTDLANAVGGAVRPAGKMQ